MPISSDRLSEDKPSDSQQYLWLINGEADFLAAQSRRDTVQDRGRIEANRELVAIGRCEKQPLVSCGSVPMRFERPEIFMGIAANAMHGDVPDANLQIEPNRVRASWS